MEGACVAAVRQWDAEGEGLHAACLSSGVSSNSPCCDQAPVLDSSHRVVKI